MADTQDNVDAQPEAQHRAQARPTKTFKAGRILQKLRDPMIWATIALVVVGSVQAIVVFLQLNVIKGQWALQDWTFRTEERGSLTYDDWNVGGLDSGAPTVSFDLENKGHTSIFLVATTYERQVSENLPKKFGPVMHLPNVPAMITRDTKYKIVVPPLSIAPAEVNNIRSGSLSLFTRVVFDFRDIYGAHYELKITSRYGRVFDANGAPTLGFDFPEQVDRDQPAPGGCAFAAARKYNVLKSLTDCPE